MDTTALIIRAVRVFRVSPHAYHNHTLTCALRPQLQCRVQVGKEKVDNTCWGHGGLIPQCGAESSVVGVPLSAPCRPRMSKPPFRKGHPSLDVGRHYDIPVSSIHVSRTDTWRVGSK